MKIGVEEYIVGENQQKNYRFLFDASSEALAKEGETSALHDAHICFYLERNATLVVEVLIACVDIKVTIDCVLRGENADARVMGAYIMNAAHKGSVVTTQHHLAANTRSTLVMKGALHDNAQTHYYGTIRVEKEAHGAYASQENKNMLLSNNARAVSVPNIEVLTQEVHCFHGSAVGRFDDEQLFYAAARGIDEATARKLLLQAFFADLFVDQKLNDTVKLLVS